MRPNVFELLNKINEILRSSSIQELSKLEFDLLKQHIQQLYEIVLVEREKKDDPKLIKEPVKELESKEVVVMNTEVNEVKTENKTPDAIQKKAEVRQDLTSEEKEEPVVKREVEELPSKDIRVTEPESGKKITPKISINEVSTGKESLNEKLKTSSTEIHKAFASKPLKDQIDLNKRFVLVKELFGDNASSFTSAIEKIDSFSNLEAANSFIKDELAVHYNWDFNSQSVKMFVKLVKQKFGKHE